MLKKVFIPFKVIALEKSYWLWIIFVVIFGLANIWGAILTGSSSFDDAMNGGSGYTFSISICAPLIAEIFIKLIVNRRSDTENHFISYKLVSTAFNIVLVFIMSFLWSGSYKNIIPLQVIFCILSVIVSFYLFCINQMDQHEEFIENFDDEKYEYLQNENNNIKELDEKSKAIDKTSTRNGDVKL